MLTENTHWNGVLRLRGLCTALVMAALLLLVGRCDTMSPLGEGKLVVEAFLQTGEPLPIITLRQTESLTVAPSDTADTLGTPARGASLSIQLNGQVVPYREVPGCPWCRARRAATRPKRPLWCRRRCRTN